MNSTIVPTHLKIELPRYLEALKEERRTLAGLATELGKNSTGDYSSALGYEAKTPNDQYAAQMFALALNEVTSTDCGAGLVRAHYGTWEHPLIGENGKVVMTTEKKSKAVLVSGRAFRFEDPTARLSGSVMLNLEFGVQNLVAEDDKVSPRKVYSATIGILNGSQVIRTPKKPRSKDDQRFYDSLKNYF